MEENLQYTKEIEELNKEDNARKILNKVYMEKEFTKETANNLSGLVKSVFERNWAILERLGIVKKRAVQAKQKVGYWGLTPKGQAIKKQMNL